MFGQFEAEGFFAFDAVGFLEGRDVTGAVGLGEGLGGFAAVADVAVDEAEVGAVEAVGGAGEAWLPDEGAGAGDDDVRGSEGGTGSGLGEGGCAPACSAS